MLSNTFLICLHLAPELGNIRQFWLWFLLSVCLPFFFVPLALMEHFRPTSLKAKYGALFGGLTSFSLGSLIAMIVIISNTTSFDVFIVLFAMLCLGLLGTIFWLRVRYLRHLAYVSVLNPVGKYSDLTDYQTGRQKKDCSSFQIITALTLLNPNILPCNLPQASWDISFVVFVSVPLLSFIWFEKGG
jgi:hypothetical protein